MPSLGQRLLQTRQAQGLSLDELATKTRISMRYLQAIETDEPSVLPGSFFYRSFVKQYAAALGLPESFGDMELEGMLREEESQEKERSKTPSEIAYSVPPIPTGGPSREDPRRWIGRLVVFASVLAVCTAAYAMWERWWPAWQQSRKQAVQQEQTPAPEPPPQTENKTQQQPAAVPESVAQQQESTTAAPPQPVPQQPAVLGKAVVMKLTAIEDAWVNVSTGGTKLFEGFLKTGESKDFESDTAVRLRVGNAGNIEAVCNGRSIGPVGPKGAVRSLDFTAEGMKPVTGAAALLPNTPGTTP